MATIRIGQILFNKGLQIGQKPQYFARNVKYYCCKYYVASWIAGKEG